MNRPVRIVVGCGAAGILCFLFLLMFLAIWQFLAPDRSPAPRVAYSEFIQLVNADPQRDQHVQSAMIQGREIRFSVKDPRSNTVSVKMTIGPEDTDAVRRELVAHQVQVSYVEPASPMSGMFALLVAFGLMAAGVATFLGFQWGAARKDLADAGAEIRRLRALLEEQRGGREEGPAPAP